MICNKCGKEIDDATIFCPHCRAYVDQTSAPAFLEDEKKPRTRRKKTGWKKLLSGLRLLFTIGASLLAVLMVFTVGQHPATVFFCITATLLVGLSLFKKWRVSKAQQPDSLETILQSYKLPSEKALTRFFIREELRSRSSDTIKPVSKMVLKRQFVYALVLAVLLFLFLNTLYYTAALLPLVCVLSLVYEMLALKTTTETLLYRLAKKHPDDRISDLVAQETYNEVETPKIKTTVLASCAVVAVAVASFVGLHLETRYQVEETENGYAVSAYVPRLFEDPEVVIPDTIDGKPITAIGEDAFSDNVYIREVTVPAAATYIDDHAFSGCSALTTVSGIDNVTHIGSGAFASCRSMRSIVLPAGLKTLNGEAFMKCRSLLAISIPEGVTEIRGNTFDGCSKLESVTLHEGIIDIHAYAFNNCGALKEIQLPSKITEIHTYTFHGCESLEFIDIPRGVTRIAAHAFSGCDALSGVYIPDSLKEIGSSAFRDCDSLMELYLPPDVSINERAFKDSPTELYEKQFTDDVVDEITTELDERKVEKLYVVYDKEQGKDTVFSYYGNNTLAVADSLRMADELEDNMGLFAVETPTEFLTYLKKARDSGFDTVEVGRYSEVATADKGETYWVSYEFTIDELIQSYEEDASEF